MVRLGREVLTITNSIKRGFSIMAYDEIGDVSNDKPHVVILGAGASRAACPNGDLNGRSIPLMKDFIEVLQLEPLLTENGIKYKGEDFEEVFSELSSNHQANEVIPKIEEKIDRYFMGLRLPTRPTIYDHLVLSLRRKDIIATFNWDPFLFDACERNAQSATLPKVVFLHGNVRVGVCFKDNQAGKRGGICGVCMKQLEPSHLLYPIKRKGYNKDPFIDNQWKKLTSALREAYMLTILGYSAPNTDVEAKGLMGSAWDKNFVKNLAQIEIIDTKEESHLLETWKDYTHFDHYDLYTDFYDSWVAKHPRRTCEALWRTTIDIDFNVSDRGIPKDLAFEGLWNWLDPLLAAEK